MLGQDALFKAVAISLALFLAAVLALPAAWAASEPAGAKAAAVEGLAGNAPLATDKAGAPESAARDHLAWRMIGALAFVFVIIGGYMIYMIYLQRKFLAVCQQEKTLSLLLQFPAGLPPGTIRAIISLLIITVSLSFVAMSVFGVYDKEFPQVLAGILGTVIGFYFGNRSATGGGEEAAQQQIKTLKDERDAAKDQNLSGEASGMITKVKKGIAMSKIALDLLPDDTKKKYSGIISKLETGMTTVEAVAGTGALSDALSSAHDLYENFAKENPVKAVFSGALDTFGKTLGTAVPAIAVASAVVAVTTKLAGAAYLKWKSRILQAPFSPAVLPLKAVDANTGLSIILNGPIFKKAFARELDANDRPFMDGLVKLLSEEKAEEFWNTYKERFESREQFETGLQEFRRIAADLELQTEIDPSLTAEAGGYKKLMEAVDRINSDPDAKASLDQLVLVTESLQNSGEPVKSIFDKVKSEVGQ